MIKEVTIYKKTAICRNWWYTFKNVCNAAEFLRVNKYGIWQLPADIWNVI